MMKFALLFLGMNFGSELASARPTTVCDSLANFYNTHGYNCVEADLAWPGGSAGLVYNCSGGGITWQMRVMKNEQGNLYCGGSTRRIEQ